MFQKLKENFIHAISKSSLLHGLWTAIIGAVAKLLLPVAEALSNGQHFTLPTWQSVIGIALGAGLVYLGKNILFGSSAPATVDTTAAPIDTTGK